jgi:hypothetical protein
MRRRNRAPEQWLEIGYEPLRHGWHARLSNELRDALPRLHALVQDDRARR